MKLTIDFESRSRCDIRACGPWVYAEHPSTEILCLAVKQGRDTARILPATFDMAQAAKFQRLPVFEGRISSVVDDADIIEAHNAEFETAMWHHICHRRWGWPDLPLEKMRCSAAKAATCALPRDLDGACRALGLPVQKDRAGHALMLKMCKPRKPTKNNPAEWVGDAESLIRLFRYCLQDVEAEHALSEALPDLSEMELAVWRLDQKINRRGVYVDMPAVDGMIAMTGEWQEMLLAEFSELTGGVVDSPRQVAALRAHLSDSGVEMDGMTKADVQDALAGQLDPKARRLLEIRQSLAKSSVSKYAALRHGVNSDSRARGLLMYHAASTGRWGGKRFQPQNLPRECVSDADLLFDVVTR